MRVEALGLKTVTHRFYALGRSRYHYSSKNLELKNLCK